LTGASTRLDQVHVAVQGVQQKVASACSDAAPVACPPVAVHEPTIGVVVNVTPCAEVAVQAAGRGERSVGVVEVHMGLPHNVTCAFVLQSTEGVLQAQVVQVRPSLTPP
jgi:hypothetical protein